MHDSTFFSKDWPFLLMRIVVQIISIVAGVFVPYWLIDLSKLPFIPDLSTTVSWENQLVWAVILSFISASYLDKVEHKRRELAQDEKRKEENREIADVMLKELSPIIKLTHQTAEIVNHFDREKYFRESSEIDVATLSGNITLELRKKETIETIIHRQNHSMMRCLIGNPFSERIRSRYIFDEPMHKKAGYSQIVQNLITLFNVREGWFKGIPPDSYQDILHIKNKLKIKVYDSYPMLAIFRGDNSVYMSYYAYKEIDTHWIATGKTTPLGKELCSHFDLLFAESRSLSKWIVENYDKLDDESKKSLLFSSYYSGVFVINNNGQIIFQRRENKRGIHNPNKLSVFGGRAEYDEPPLTTAIRELIEETDIKIADVNGRLVKVYERPELEPDNDEECVFCTYYCVQIDADKINVKEGSGSETLIYQEALRSPDVTKGPKDVLRASDALRQMLKIPA